MILIPGMKNLKSNFFLCAIGSLKTAQVSI